MEDHASERDYGKTQIQANTFYRVDQDKPSTSQFKDELSNKLQGNGSTGSKRG